MEQASDAIRNLVSRYSDAVWRLDADAYGACWADEGVWAFMGQAIKGRDAIVPFWIEFMKNFRKAWQMVNNPVLLVEGDRARQRLYVEETVFTHDGANVISKGIYHDDLVIERGEWKFARRHFDLVYYGPADMSGRLFDTADYGLSPTDPDPSRPATPSMQEFLAALGG